MKLNALTNVRNSVFNERCDTWAFADRATTKEELQQWLQQHKTRAVPRKKNRLQLWLDKFSTWFSVRFLNDIAVGYEDERGFHYGPNPANAETQERPERFD